MHLFHSQLGVALGFLLPPLLVQNHDDLELVGRDFQLMFYLIAGFTTLLVTLVVLCKCLSSVLFCCRIETIDDENISAKKLQ